MKKGKPFFFRPFWALMISLSALAGCSNEAPKHSTTDPEVVSETMNDGTPTTISFKQVDHIEPPEDFANRGLYQAEDPEQNEKFIFDAQPGESVAIVNPSEDVVTAEDIESAVTIRDAFADDGEKDPNKRYLVADASTSKKRFRVCDPETLKPLTLVRPNQRALLLTEEPTEGGDLTIITKDEYLPINFEGKNSSVNELIVATEREDVEEFDPNDEGMTGLLFSKVIDYGDLEQKAEGSFLYKEAVSLKQGDQFYIGDNPSFDITATFYTFMSCVQEQTYYRIKYTAPDYSICYNKLDIHKQDMKVDFSSDDVTMKLPSQEDLIRQLNEDGGIIDKYEEEVLPEALLQDPVVGPALMQAFTPSVSIAITIDRVWFNINIAFSIEDSAIVTQWGITATYAIKTSAAGSYLFRGGANIYYKQTYSTYMDYKISWWPYPKLNYVVCVKTTDEMSVTFSAGLAYAMKTDAGKDEKYDYEKQVDALKKDIESLKQTIRDYLPKSMPKVNGGAAAGGQPNAAKTPFTSNQGPKDAIWGKDPKKDDYTYAHNDGIDLGEAKFVGDGIVIAGPGGVIATPYIIIEFGVSVYFTPNIQGKLFYTFSKVSTNVRCKVASGFETPEGYQDNVERSSSQHTLGLYCQIGFEVGAIFELCVYIAGTKSICYVSLAFTVGVYLTIQAVAMITWGDDSDVEGMGYFSIELGLVLRASVRIIAAKKYFIIDVASWQKKIPLLAFGTNLHFLDFVDKRKEIDFMGGKYLNINDFGVLSVKYFSTAGFSVGTVAADWNYEAYFASAIVPLKLRLFCDLDIVEGDQYIKFNDKTALFEVLDGAPEKFDFKIKIYTDAWLGITMPNKTLTVHYTSNEVRAINFLDYKGERKLVDGVYLGGGMLRQGDVYQAPTMPAQSDGTPFYGWVGNNGLFLAPGETMTVGAMSITYRAFYRPQSVYLVNFYDGYNNLIISERIVDGGSAEEPVAKQRDAKMNGAKFIGWDRDFTSVHSDINVYGIYAKGGKTA